VQHTAQAPTDTLFLHAYNGPQGSSFTYYEDDGSSFDHEKGTYLKQKITLNPKSRSLSFAKAEGSGYTSKFKHVKVILHGFDKVKNGKAEKYVFIKALPNFDPQGNGSNDPGCQVSTFTVPMGAGASEVKF
jgi:alpha-glucosidase